MKNLQSRASPVFFCACVCACVCNLSVHSSAGKRSWTYFDFSLTSSKHEHGRGCSLPCLLLVSTSIAVHLTLAQRVLHPSLTLNVRIIVCTHVKRETKVVYSRKKLLKDCIMFPAGSVTQVPGVVQAVFSIYGFINGTVIYTHVCILVCI